MIHIVLGIIVSNVLSYKTVTTAVTVTVLYYKAVTAVTA